LIELILRKTPRPAFILLFRTILFKNIFEAHFIAAFLINKAGFWKTPGYKSKKLRTSWPEFFK